MSIDFKAVVKITTRYFNEDGVLDASFETELATMELGNFRALRTICTKTEDGYIDECGTRSIDLVHAMHWLSTAFEQDCPVQVQSAIAYINTVNRMLNSTDDHQIEVIVSWS